MTKCVLEDFQEGQTIALGEYLMTAEDIVDFARRYDPQAFHVDPSDPRTVGLGGLLASGWHTASVFMRLAVDAYLDQAAILTSPGVDELRWPAPVRPGDTLTGEVVIGQVRVSRSKPDRGILMAKGALWNQRRETVLSVNTTAFIKTRAGYEADTI